MTNDNVTVYLNTPLFNSSQKGLGLEGILMIRGKIFDESSAGITLQVKGIGNEKRWLEETPFKKMIIPHHKIDFMVVE